MKKPKEPEEMEVKVHCAFDKYEKVANLKPHPKNPNKHPKTQIKVLAGYILKTGWRHPVVVSKLSGCIVAGEGRYHAAIEMGCDEVPVSFQEFKDENEEIEFILADNRLPELSKIDKAQRTDLLIELANAKRDIRTIGFDRHELEKKDGVLGDNPEVEFSQILGEANNYVVLKFENEIDWEAAKTHFKLKPVVSKRANGKPWSKGIGRVIDGAEYLKRIKQ